MEWIKGNSQNNDNVLEKHNLYHNNYYEGVLYLWQYTDQQLIKTKELPTEPFYIFNSKKEEYIIDAQTTEEAKKKALEIILKEMEEKLDRYRKIIEETENKYQKMCRKIKDCGFELKDKYREYDYLYDMYIDEFEDATEEEIEEWRKDL